MIGPAFLRCTVLFLKVYNQKQSIHIIYFDIDKDKVKCYTGF